MTNLDKAEIIVKFFEALSNRYSEFLEDERIATMVRVTTERYNELKRKTSFSESAYRANVEAMTKLLEVFEKQS